ncbi:TRAP transporter small permease [Aquibacillus rhizosphaerae]|uniref:TRAP transporter small permease n=1 Tax=Aquibacillus rhizosphaerae TaxID=3051431 RepID=A0ABT7L5A4_9BACI|nr:TRAP transporter small permease [Aquibacillus sp. LR5S19]MDL4840367.1 TRAP transporter small permease [Aquibacillus sp. LR5S19]
MLYTIKKWLDRLILSISYFLTFVLVIGALWQVFSRYVLSEPSTFTNELLRFLLVWTALLGASYAFGSNKHLALTFVKNKIKGKSWLVVSVINDVFILAFAILVLIKGGSQLVETTMTQLTPILQIPMGVVYSILPISGIIIVLYKILNIKFYAKPAEKVGE